MTVAPVTFIPISPALYHSALLQSSAAHPLAATQWPGHQPRIAAVAQPPSPENMLGPLAPPLDLEGRPQTSTHAVLEPAGAPIEPPAPTNPAQVQAQVPQPVSSGEVAIPTATSTSSPVPAGTRLVDPAPAASILPLDDGVLAPAVDPQAGLPDRLNLAYRTADTASMHPALAEKRTLPPWEYSQFHIEAARAINPIGERGGHPTFGPRHSASHPLPPENLNGEAIEAYRISTGPTVLEAPSTSAPSSPPSAPPIPKLDVVA